MYLSSQSTPATILCTAMAVAVIGVLVTVATLNQGFTIKNKIINLIDLNRCAEATQRQTDSEICSELVA